MVHGRSLLLPIALVTLIGCQPKSEPLIAQPPTDAAKILGTYRLKATPDEVAEIGGLEKLPQLVVNSDHFRLIIDGEESSGIWKYESGVLSLSDKETGETNTFKVDSTGTELTEESEDPIVFQKYGVGTPSAEAK